MSEYGLQILQDHSQDIRKRQLQFMGITKYKGGIDKLVLSGKMLGKLNIVVESFNSW